MRTAQDPGMDDLFHAFDRVWLTLRVVGYGMIAGLVVWMALGA